MYWIIGILFVHFVADWILQTQWQAANKSKNWNALGSHVAVYTACFLLPSIVLASFHAPPDNRPSWAILNGVLHFVTDAITSRQTAKRWNNGKPSKGFWVWIGLDQWVHATTLIATWQWLCAGGVQ